MLIDVAALKGVDMLPDTYEITVQDLQQALARQKQTLQPGDAVIINTGWGRLWAKDNARYVKSCPGIGVAAAEWLAKQDPMLVGSDNWPVEVAPNPDPQTVAAGASGHAGRQRHPPAREHEARRAGRQARVRVRVRHAAAQDAGILRLDGCTDRGALNVSRIAPALPVLALLATAAVAPRVEAQDRARDYPTRPIRIVIGIAPGGGLDTITRVAAQRIGERLKQTAVVDNRPGGGTVLAMDLMAQATPDGYTIMCASETFILNGVLKRVRYDVRKAFDPVVRISTQPYILVANPSLPASTIKELIALAKAKPGALSFGTPGVGTTIHIGWERLKAMTGTDLLHVPYKGGAPAVIDAMSGQIHLVITTTITAGAHIKSGKLKALAVTGPNRVSIYPEVPTIAESLAGFELTNSYGFFVPAGTPKAIIDTINEAAIESMNTPETRKILAADGADVAPPISPAEFRAKVEQDYVMMEKIMQSMNLKLQ